MDVGGTFGLRMMAAAPPLDELATADPSVYMTVEDGWMFDIIVDAALLMLSAESDFPEHPSRCG